MPFRHQTSEPGLVSGGLLAGAAFRFGSGGVPLDPDENLRLDGKPLKIPPEILKLDHSELALDGSEPSS